jgi:hypothetical protein
MFTLTEAATGLNKELVLCSHFTEAAAGRNEELVLFSCSSEKEVEITE